MGTKSARKRRQLMKKMVRDEFSAGGIVVRPGTSGDWDVLLIATHEGGRWSLPKGHVEPNESPEEAALREVREETGVEAEILAPVDTIDYWYRWKCPEGTVLIHKRVTFYLMRYKRGDVRHHGWEVDEARWFPFEEAKAKVSYDDERRLLQRARQILLEQMNSSAEGITIPPDAR